MDGKRMIDCLKADDVSYIESAISDGLSINSILPVVMHVSPTFLRQSPTLICAAAFYGAFECFRFLFQSGANTDKADDKGRKLCEYAAAGGSIDICRFLDVNSFKFNENCIPVAAKSGSYSTFMWLILNKTKGISPTKKYADLPHQAAQGGDIKILKYVIEEMKFKPNASNEHAESPLHFACKSGNAEVVEYLIQEAPETLNKKNWVHFLLIGDTLLFMLHVEQIILKQLSY